MRILIGIAILACSCVAFAASSPEDAASAYAEAVMKQDWRTATGQFRADDLRRVRSTFTRLMSGAGGEGSRRSLFGDMSIEEIAKLSDAQFCEKIFFGYFSTFRGRNIQLEIDQTSILGVVRDGDTTAHVVVKQKGTIDGHQMEVVDITTVIRDAGDWRIAVPAALETLIAVMEARAEISAGKFTVPCEDIYVCVKVIQAAVIKNWFPLLDATSLKVKLKVSLDDTFAVSDVAVAESSGDARFDESALDAVRRAAAFTELRGLDRATFEKNFRTFYFNFAPGAAGDQYVRP